MEAILPLDGFLGGLVGPGGSAGGDVLGGVGLVIVFMVVGAGPGELELGRDAIARPSNLLYPPLPGRH